MHALSHTVARREVYALTGIGGEKFNGLIEIQIFHACGQSECIVVGSDINLGYFSEVGIIRLTHIILIYRLGREREDLVRVKLYLCRFSSCEEH